MGEFVRTGRTRRMIERGVEAAREGIDCIIYVSSSFDVTELYSRVCELTSGISSRRFLRTKATFQFNSAELTITLLSPTFDWELMRDPGTSKKTLVLVDHWVIEQRFPLAIRMLYQFMKDPYQQEKNRECSDDGGTTSYYQFPPGAKQLQDLIEHKQMNFSVGNIFKAAWRLGEGNSSPIRDLKKIIWFAKREITRRNENEAG